MKNPMKRVGWLDWLVYKIFYKRWTPIFEKRPDLVEVLSEHIMQWKRNQRIKHKVEILAGEPSEAEYTFSLSGNILAPKDADHHTDYKGNIVGFFLDENHVARIFLGLEVEDLNETHSGKAFTYISTDEMDKLGFEIIDYSQAGFMRDPKKESVTNTQTDKQ